MPGQGAVGETASSGFVDGVHDPARCLDAGQTQLEPQHDHRVGGDVSPTRVEATGLREPTWPGPGTNMWSSWWQIIGSGARRP